MPSLANHISRPTMVHAMCFCVFVCVCARIQYNAYYMQAKGALLRRPFPFSLAPSHIRIESFAHLQRVCVCVATDGKCVCVRRSMRMWVCFYVSICKREMKLLVPLVSQWQATKWTSRSCCDDIATISHHPNYHNGLQWSLDWETQSTRFQRVASPRYHTHNWCNCQRQSKIDVAQTHRSRSHNRHLKKALCCNHKGLTPCEATNSPVARQPWFLWPRKLGAATCFINLSRPTISWCCTCLFRTNACQPYFASERPWINCFIQPK